MSGEIADRMGRMMKEISANIQVTAIIHLPQVASKGESHYVVYKEDDDTSTHTRIRQLSYTERVGAIASMLGGSRVDEAAVSAAKSLLSDN